MISNIFTSILSLFSGMGYPGIIILMTIESSFIPFPSEIVIPPAAYLASQGQMNIYLVIASGVVGSLLGALFNYYFALFLGRPLIYKLVQTKTAKLLLLNKESVEKAEKYFEKNGSISTFIGRLIPVIRQLISIPAGLAKMNIWKFILYTILGSTIWNTILGILGYSLGANKELLEKYYTEIKYILLIACPLFLAIFFLIKYKNKKSTKKIIEPN